MGWAMIAMAAVAAVGSIVQGYAGKQAAEFEAEQYQREEQRARLAAQQAEVERRQELHKVLASQAALRAGAGVDLYSGTGMTLRSASIDEAETDILNDRINYLGRADQARIARVQTKAAGKQSLIGGLLGAAGKTLQTYGQSSSSSGSSGG